MTPPRHHHALDEGYQLHWYEIDSILGQGGFGITYLARDTNLDQLVAIKEFLPSDLAARTEDSVVHPLTGGHTDTYGWGLNRFLTEARTLAKFRHPNIVRVLSVFEANNTAYMVMEYERGESFENLLKFKQIKGEPALKSTLLALLDGLELVHDAGFIHRDIKPSNVYLREDGVPVLLDFGSARLALGVETRTLTSLVSPGYAPFEQYNATRESDKQGPWTDIYALGATMYRAVTGHGPVDAAARANLLLDEQRDPFEPCAQMGIAGFSPEFLHAIDRALAFPPGERPQSVAAWRQLVVAGAVDTEAETRAVTTGGTSAHKVDIPLESEPAPQAPPGPDTGTRTVPLAEMERTRETGPGTAPATAPAATGSGRGWFIATTVVVIIGVAVAAWLTLVPRKEGESAPGPIATVPAPSSTQSESARAGGAPATPAREASTAPGTVAAPGAPTPAATATAPPEAEPTRSGAEPAATAAATAAATVAAVETPPAAPAKTAPEPAAPERKPSEPPAVEKKAPEPAAVEEKTPEKKVTEQKAPPKKAPEKVAKVAPAKKAPAPAPAKKAAPPPPKKKAPAKPSAPKTREEKAAALVVSGDAHFKANRITKPKKRNALSDYLTALAINKENEAAQAGVEKIARHYVALAEKATGAGQFEKANADLKLARFVLDAMKLRKWPQDRYDGIFAEYREAGRALALAR